MKLAFDKASVRTKDIVVDPDASESDGKKMFGWDGDGRDRIISVKEKQIAQDGKQPTSRLKDIVNVLGEIIPLIDKTK